MSKPIIATASLAGCFGCHMSFLDIDERILELVEIADIGKSPITDIKKFDRMYDVGIIEGGVCNSENVHVLKEFRENCRILVSLGECAIMGGLPALRNNIPIQELLAEAYLDGPTTAGNNPEGILPNDEELPVITDKVYPCHEIVKVDYFLPGCPPPADIIWKALLSIIKGEPLDLSYGLIKYD